MTTVSVEPLRMMKVQTRSVWFCKVPVSHCGTHGSLGEPKALAGSAWPASELHCWKTLSSTEALYLVLDDLWGQCMEEEKGRGCDSLSCRGLLGQWKPSSCLVGKRRIRVNNITA